MRNILSILVLFCTGACTPFAYSSPPPTPEHLSVVYTPALGWIEENLNQCSLDHPEIVLTTEVRPASSIEGGASTVTLTLGTIPEGFSGTATQLGWEQVVVIANTEIPTSQLELPDLQNLYTSLEPQFQAWTYPKDSELRLVFDEKILNNSKHSPHLIVAPSPTSMLAEIEGASQAVGFIPESTLVDQNIQKIPLPEEVAATLRLPIIALTNEEPAGAVRAFLNCLSISPEQE